MAPTPPHDAPRASGWAAAVLRPFDQSTWAARGELAHLPLTAPEPDTSGDTDDRAAPRPRRMPAGGCSASLTAAAAVRLRPNPHAVAAAAATVTATATAASPSDAAAPARPVDATELRDASPTAHDTRATASTALASTSASPPLPSPSPATATAASASASAASASAAASSALAPWRSPAAPGIGSDHWLFARARRLLTPGQTLAQAYLQSWSNGRQTAFAKSTTEAVVSRDAMGRLGARVWTTWSRWFGASSGPPS
ncbi:hypothetical protein CXG81DRAFT_24805 [Caulochytrium protostelioides]|uniref:Uncharacterized protein n=1 Tax=Caulochytrium protostelioides TaxID=1555241 RepID=A0A4P9XAW1_9FUNG|nr:hypothetical protein CXG81DRAFT_24805 [Caulochytrium protostelioides]|eukprot:RKP02518.1 hypothetical protein CXG81DRAFT_24805 [Caulochytrium protostelioides]